MNYKVLFSTILLLVSFQGVHSQQIRQAPPVQDVCAGVTITYEGFGMTGSDASDIWIASGGTVLGTSTKTGYNNSTIYIARVRWHSAGSGTISKGNASTTVTIYPSGAPSGGTARANGKSSVAVCKNGTASSIMLTGYTGRVSGWFKRQGSGSWSEIKTSSGSSILGTTLSSSYVSNTTAYSYRARLSSPCSNQVAYSSSVSITIKNAPAALALSGGASFCQSDPNSEAVMAIRSPQREVTYKLYRSGASSPVSAARWSGTTWTGTGVSYANEVLKFDGQRTAGTYTAKAQWYNSCSSLITTLRSPVQVIAISTSIAAGSIRLNSSPVCYSANGIVVKESSSPSGGSNYSYQWTFVDLGDSRRTEYTFSTSRGSSPITLTYETIKRETGRTTIPASLNIARRVSANTSCGNKVATSSMVVNVRGGAITLAGSAVGTKTLCGLGSTTRLDPGNASYVGRGTISYLWQQSGDNSSWSSASGTNNQRYYDTPGNQSGDKYYRRRVTLAQSGYSSCNVSSYTGGIRVTVVAPPEKRILSGPSIYCPEDIGNGLSLNIYDPQPGVTYRLYRNGTLHKTLTWQSGSWPGYTNQGGARRIAIEVESPDGRYTAQAQWASTCSSQSTDLSGLVEATLINPTITPGSISLATSIVCYTDERITLRETAAPTGASNYAYEWKFFGRDGGSTSMQFPFAEQSGQNEAVSLDFTTIENKLGYRPTTLHIIREATSTTACGPRVAVASLVIPIRGGKINSSNQPTEDQHICEVGQSITLDPGVATHQGSGLLSYRWQQSANGATWTEAVGNNQAITYTTAASLVGEMQFRRVATLRDGECQHVVITNPTMVYGPYGVTLSQRRVACYGEDVVLAATSSAYPDTRYVWYDEAGICLSEKPILVLEEATASQTFRVIARNETTCEVTQSITTRVESAIAHTPEFKTLQKAGPLQYRAVFDNLQPGQYRYTWTDDNAADESRIFTSAGRFSVRAEDKTTGCQGPVAIVEIPDVFPKQLDQPVVAADLNYVRSFTYRQKDVDENINGASPQQVQMSTQYLDGLGRPWQQVAKQGSPNNQDLVTPYQYDARGRQVRSYLPYAASQADGAVQGTPYQQQSRFYQSADRVARSQFPFTFHSYEASPLNRGVSEAAPGEDWVGTTHTDQHHDIAYQYRGNERREHVIRWELSDAQASVNRPDQLKASGEYDQGGELWVTATRDENQGSKEDAYETREYQDKLGRIVLKAVDNEAGETLRTYYVYDRYNNVRAVIPPKAVAQFMASGSTTLSEATRRELCFAYDYDDRKRLAVKHVPGAEPVYLVYDRRDRLVLTQDGNQRSKKQWLFTKYDGLNRPIFTGLYRHPGKAVDQAAMQQFMNGKNFSELYNGSSDTYGYTNAGFPNVTNVPQLFSVTYYDKYDFLTDLGWDEGYRFQDITTHNEAANYPTQAFDPVRGQVTGNLVRVLNTKNYLNSVTYYDDRYRPIQTISKNNLDGLDVVTNRYDFIGQLLHRLRLHSSKKVDQLALQERYVYGHAGRLREVYHRVDEEPEVLMVQNTYNALGELVDKQLHYQGEEDLATYLTATLSASKSYNPSVWQDGELRLPSPKKVAIPKRIPVSVGNSGNHTLTLTYRDATNQEHTVTYRGGASVSHVYRKDGTESNQAQLQSAQYYAFYSSSNGINAGQTITVSYLKLSVNNGDSWDPAGATGARWSIEPPASLFVQSVDYRYNIRGWLTSINNSTLSDDGRTNNDENDYFGMELLYNQQATALDNTLQYNGNISAVKWSHYGPAPEVLSYTYQYDPVNRLTNAEFSNLTNPIRNGLYDVTGPEGKIQYDPNGNIEQLMRYGAEGTTRTLMDDLSYAYQGNQLLTVGDVASGEFAAQGFRDGTNQGDDYRYDANGNLVEDWNKDIIDEIKYNHLNLPRIITSDTGGEIRYTYDATGRKLRKRVTEEKNIWVTDYVDGIQYGRERLESGEKSPKGINFIMTAEGRIRHSDEGNWVYDYDMKDHLGNVRMTIASEARVDTYVATMENRYRKDEEAMFQNVANTRHIYQNANATPATDKLKRPKASARLNAAQGRDLGPTKSLAVAFGDTVRLSVQAYYENFAEGNGAAIGSALANIVSAFAPAGMVDGQLIQDALSAPEALANLGYKDDDGSGTPAAYLNYMLFDEDYVLLDHGFQRVSTAAENQHQTLELEVPIGQPGYLYLYVSNQSNWDSNVFFDELIVEHRHSPVQDNVDYYPFGLLMSGRSYVGTSNRYLFNGKELQEETGWYDFGARMYDPGLGRWMSPDPLSDEFPSHSVYNYALNNPVRFIDPDGQAPFDPNCPGCPPPSGSQIVHEGRQQFVDESVAYFTGMVEGIKTVLGFTEANDVSVLATGRNIDGSQASGLDYTLAGAGIFLPISNKTLKEGVEKITNNAFTSKTSKKVVAKVVGTFDDAAKRFGELIGDADVRTITTDDGRVIKTAQVDENTTVTFRNFSSTEKDANAAINVVDKQAIKDLEKGRQGVEIKFFNEEN